MRNGMFGYAFKNLVRRPARSLSVVLALAALSFVLFLTSAIYISVQEGISLAGRRLGADAVVLPGGEGTRLGDLLLSGAPSKVYMPDSVIEKAASVEGVSAVAPQIFLSSALTPCCSLAETMLVGFDPDRDLTVTPWLRRKIKRPPLSDEIVVGDKIVNEVGGKLRFYGKLFTIVGKLDPTGLEYFDSTIFIHVDGVEEIRGNAGTEGVADLEVPEGKVSAVLVRFNEDADRARSMLRLRLALEGLDIVAASDAMEGVRKRMLAPLRTLMAAAVVQWFVSLMLVGAVFSLLLSGRAREFGLLLAIGARGRDVLAAVVAEAAMLSGAGALIGTAAGLGVVAMSKEGLFSLYVLIGADVPLPGAGVLLALGGAVFLFTFSSALLACVFPLVRVGRIAPFDSLISRGQDS